MKTVDTGPAHRVDYRVASLSLPDRETYSERISLATDGKELSEPELESLKDRIHAEVQAETAKYWEDLKAGRCQRRPAWVPKI